MILLVKAKIQGPIPFQKPHHIRRHPHHHPTGRQQPRFGEHRRRKAAAKMLITLDVHSVPPNFIILKNVQNSGPKTAWEL